MIFLLCKKRRINLGIHKPNKHTLLNCMFKKYTQKSKHIIIIMLWSAMPPPIGAIASPIVIPVQSSFTNYIYI